MSVESDLLLLVERNIERIKELQLSYVKLGNDSNKSRETFEILMDIGHLYKDTEDLLNMVTSDENSFRVNRFFKELAICKKNYQPTVLEKR